MNLNKMKVVYTRFLTILICFIPVLVFCQSEPPLLLLSNTGAGGLEGMKLELNDQTLLNPGPSITFEAPDPMIPESGRLIIGTNGGIWRYIIENIGSSGQDGLRMKIRDLNSSIEWADDWNTNTGVHKQFYGNFFDIGVEVKRTFELDTPRIVEVVSSNNPLAKGTLVRSTSLSEGELRTQFGNNPDNLCSILYFDPTSPSLRHSIESNLPSVMGRSLNTIYNPGEGVLETAYGNWPNVMVQVLDLDGFRITESIESTDPTVPDSSFRTIHDLELGEIRTGFGHFNGLGGTVNGLSETKIFQTNPPRLQTRIQSALAPPDSFFDIFYDLEEASMSQTYQGLTKRDKWISVESFSWRVNSVSLPEVDFNIEYDLAEGTEKHLFTDATGTIRREFNNLTLAGVGSGTTVDQQIIGSSLYPDNDFTTTCNLAEMSVDEYFQDLHHTQTYNPGAGIFGFAVESTSFPFQKMEVKYQTLDRLIQTSVHDLHEIQTFDPEFGIFIVSRESSAPSLSERSFISEYNLTTGESIDRAVKPPGTLLPHVKRMEGSGPNVKLKYASTDPPLVDKIFEVDYNMATGTIQESFQNLRFEKQIQIESCQFGIHSTLLPNNSITTDYNLAEGSILTKHKEGGHKETIEIDSWRMGVSSDLLPDDDFEVVYDLADHACTTSFNDLDHSQTFDPVAGTLVNTIMSSNPAMLSCTNGYDLASRSISESFGTLHCTKTFDPDLHKVVQTFESEGPMVASLDIEYILAEEVITSRRLHHFQNQFDVDLTDEFNVASRIFTEACTDGTNTLTVARQLDTPIGPTFAIGGNLSIESGSTISSTGGAPLLLTGPVVVDGIQTITGSLDIAGDLNVTGTKNFKIDHPLDPDNKYLIHSCIESPDMMNIYNGNATTDEKGYVTIQLPDYFEALNNDFRYQLTCMGQFAQAIVDQKIKDNTFIIRTDKPNVEVSWQVTGIRHDPASRRNTFAVEVEKEAEMKGKRLYNK